MNLNYIIPLCISCLAIFVSVNSDVKTLDGIPRLLAPCIGFIGLIWFFNVIPWLLKVACIVILLSIRKNFLIQ
ncbi:MAG: hypothetical protein F6K08_27315 [Okeania sp. SIO1H6]|uniref:Uncharacterized protein n=1 Tax=Okeania hirsuta TaxID=1458930 RepID=A0A3N6NS95_9CYAN|nr:hypothetical protein [Okeania hirsuta]NET16269.1 hypothetical protein [Okeania sp. SIO1H6]RQH21136.1 hypothetical protein D4Z78_10065 [Okeania hirsuta]RQH40866.1 hypothetical protein D5R40_15905 [Okeania hirsuta]